MTARMIPDMSNKDYHDYPAIGSSGLKALDRSPAHYWAAYRDENREKLKDTLFMRRGTAWHAAMFEPHKFANYYAPRPDVHPSSTVWKVCEAYLQSASDEDFEKLYTPIPDGISRASKDGKALIAEIEAQGKTAVEFSKYHQAIEIAKPLKGKELLKQEQLDKVNAAVSVARNVNVIDIMLSQPSAFAECSMFWIDAETGVECKIRPDFMIMPCEMFPFGLIVDGKSTQDASPAGFPRQAWNWKMYLQAAFYSDGFMQIMGTDEPPPFLWLSQEMDAPYACAVYQASNEWLEYGRKEVRRLLNLYADCCRNKRWPAYPQLITELTVPSFAERTIAKSIGE